MFGRANMEGYFEDYGILMKFGRFEHQLDGYSDYL